MAVRIEKNGSVWTVIHDRPQARNAMDPASADALTKAFLEFDADKTAAVAVFYGAGGAFCAGWELKYVSTLEAAHPLRWSRCRQGVGGAGRPYQNGVQRRLIRRVVSHN